MEEEIILENQDGENTGPKTGPANFMFLASFSWLGYYIADAWWGVPLFFVLGWVISLTLGLIMAFFILLGVAKLGLILFIAGEAYGAYLFAYGSNVVKGNALLPFDWLKDNPNISGIIIISLSFMALYVYKWSKLNRGNHRAESE